MENANDIRILLCTIDSVQHGRDLVRTLVEEQLIACGNIIEGVSSIYRWQDRIEESQECLLILKTHKSLAERCEKRVVKLHPYDVPEFVSLTPDHIHGPYASWLRESVGLIQEMIKT